MYCKLDIDPKLKIKKIDDILTLPVLIKVHKFNEESIKQFMLDFQAASNADQPVIPIVIDSYGGEVYSLLHMIDIIKTSKLPVATIALGKAMSCGAALFTCGAEGMRFISPHSTLMIHDVSNGSHGKNEEIKADARETERLNDLLYKFMAANVGKPEKYFWDLVQSKGRADWFLSAEDAKSHNLANVIGLPKFNISVKVDINFSI